MLVKRDTETRRLSETPNDKQLFYSPALVLDNVLDRIDRVERFDLKSDDLAVSR